MDLDKIRKGLIDLEDKIIELICRRYDYKKNLFIYECNSKELKKRYEKNEIKGINLESYNFKKSYLDNKLKDIEETNPIELKYNYLDNRPYYNNKKYLEELEKDEELNSEDEYCFFRRYNKIRKFSKKININSSIKKAYINFINELCEEGEDKDVDNPFIYDVINLQTISRRIHYGVYVMEAKYINDKSEYDRLLLENNESLILSKLKNKKIEEEMLERIEEKLLKRGLKKKKIEQIINFFINIISKTIEVELAYINLKKELIE